MKTALLLSVVATLSVSQASVFAQGSCASGGSQQRPRQDLPGGPFTGGSTKVPFPTVPAPGGSTQTPTPPHAIPAVASAPAAPQARITVIGEGPSSTSVANQAPAARITLLPEMAAEVDGNETISSPADDPPALAENAEPKPAESEATKLPESLRGLVGKWVAVARQGDGELTTVELQLDDRGWVELSVPGADNERTTIKRRLEFEDEELKLIGPDAKESWGKLLEHNERQMVLARGVSRLTFVRQQPSSTPAAVANGKTLLSALADTNR